MGSRLLTCVVVLLASALPARADKASDARALFQEANAHFAVGEFADAGKKYQEAYKLKPDAALLYNAAQSYRLAGDSQKALVLYKNYLQFYPKARNIDEVRGQIEKLEQAIAASESAKTAPPQGTAEHPEEPKPAPPPPTVTPPPPTPAPTATAEPTPPPVEHKTPVYKKWWLWTIVGVVVAGGVVGGVLAATLPNGKWQTVNDLGPGAQSAALGVHW